MVYTYNGILLSHKNKKNKIFYSVTWMDLEKIILSKSEKDNYMISVTFGNLKKIIQMNLYTEHKQTSDTENRLQI